MTKPFSSAVLRALDILFQNGFHGYLVGGCVRDHLMGIPLHDYDITTDATPEEMKRVFSAFRVIETGIRHGTLTVLMEGEPLEITTFRVDGEYADNRHPDGVTFTRSLREDTARRDFTVNAIAWNPREGIVDYHGGAADIERRVLRAVGEPARRFEEDALRILRGLRFASVLGFSIEEKTARALREQAHLLVHISRERVLAELKRLLCGQAAERILLDYASVIAHALPELRPAVEEYLAAPQGETPYRFAASALKYLPPDEGLRFAALLAPLGTTGAEAVLRGLRADNRLIRCVELLCSHRATALRCDRISLRRALCLLGEEMLFKLIALQKAERIARAESEAALAEQEALALTAMTREILAAGDCYCLKMLAIGGNDLKALCGEEGIPLRGEQIGECLSFLLDAVIRGLAENRRESLWEYAKAGYLSPKTEGK